MLLSVDETVEHELEGAFYLMHKLQVWQFKSSYQSQSKAFDKIACNVSKEIREYFQKKGISNSFHKIGVRLANL